MSLVSVILPTYNRSQYIREAVQSVLEQTFKDFELIIIDDGSTDNTIETVKAFLKDKRIRYVKQENAGAAAARNRGLSMSTGNYIAFIDSDDIWEKDKINIQLSIMNALPDVSLVFSDFSSMDRNGNIQNSHLRTYFHVLDEYNLDYEHVFNQYKHFDNIGKVYWGNIYKTMIFGNIILTSTCMCRKEIFTKVGVFDTRYKMLEDYDLFLKITQEFNVAIVDRPLVRYQYSNNQLSGEANFDKLCTNLIGIFNKNIAATTEKDFLERNARKIRRRLGMYQAMQAYNYFSHDNVRLAVRFYWQSIRNNPVNYKSYIYLLLSFLPSGIIRLLKKCKNNFMATFEFI